GIVVARLRLEATFESLSASCRSLSSPRRRRSCSRIYTQRRDLSSTWRRRVAHQRRKTMKRIPLVLAGLSVLAGATAQASAGSIQHTATKPFVKGFGAYAKSGEFGEVVGPRTRSPAVKVEINPQPLPPNGKRFR